MGQTSTKTLKSGNKNDSVAKGGQFQSDTPQKWRTHNQHKNLSVKFSSNEKLLNESTKQNISERNDRLTEDGIKHKKLGHEHSSNVPARFYYMKRFYWASSATKTTTNKPHMLIAMVWNYYSFVTYQWFQWHQMTFPVGVIKPQRVTVLQD